MELASPSISVLANKAKSLPATHKEESPRERKGKIGENLRSLMTITWLASSLVRGGGGGHEFKPRLRQNLEFQLTT
jgi:hypothetical protein